MSQRVVIVGAGPGGLAAALMLSGAGVEVTVLERLNEVGGRSRTLEADGFRFDMGPTFFLYPQILREILAHCDRRLEDEVDLIRLDPQYHLVFGGGGEIQATHDLERMAQAVAELAPQDAAALPRFLADNRVKMEAFRPVLQSDFSSLLGLLRPSVMKSLPLLRPLHSVDADLQRYFSDPRVRLAFSFQSKYLGMSPFRCPSLFTILSFMEYEYGVYHPRGGCGALMESLARIARERGVEIKTGEAVEKIRFEGRKAVGVETAQGDYPLDALVINADFARSMTKLVPDHLRRRWRDRKLEKKKYSCSTFMLYLGMEGTFDDVSHHTIYLSEDYEENVAEIENGDRLPDNPSFYVQNACVTDPSLAPPGHSTLYVLAPVANLNGGIDWQQESAGFRRKILASLEKIGIKDIERRIRYEKVLTPLGWQDDMEIHRGATFNLAHSFDQMLYWRPHNRFEDLDGVYLVGGGTHPGSGLPVIFESARISSRLMARDLGFELSGERGAAAAPASGDLVGQVEEAV